MIMVELLFIYLCSATPKNVPHLGQSFSVDGRVAQRPQGGRGRFSDHSRVPTLQQENEARQHNRRCWGSAGAKTHQGQRTRRALSEEEGVGS